MAWTKSPPELVERFDRLVPDAPDVERRQMFGYPAAFVGGHMAMGLHQDRMVVRLDDAGLAEFTRTFSAEPFEPMPGRPMRGFAVVPAALLDDAGALGPWLERSIEHARSQPPKTPRRRPASKPAAGGRGGA